MKGFIFTAFFALAAFAAAQTDDEASFTEASVFVQSFLKQGKDETACAQVANAAIQDIQAACTTQETAMQNMAKGKADCCKAGAKVLCAAKKNAADTAKKAKECQDKANGLKKAKVAFPSRALDELSPGKCETFFEGESYTNARDKAAAAVKECEAYVGAQKAFNTAVKTAESGIQGERDTCHNGDKAQFATAYQTAKQTCESPSNKKAFTRAKHMLCILENKNLAECKVGTPPSISEIDYSNAKCEPVDKIKCEAQKGDYCTQKRCGFAFGINTSDQAMLTTDQHGNWAVIPGYPGKPNIFRSIEASDYHVYGVLYNDEILYRKNKPDPKLNWEKISGKLKQVTSSGNRHVWGVGTTGESLFYASGKGKPWVRQTSTPGKLKWIAVSGEEVWGVNTDNDVYYRKGTGGSFRKVEPKMKQITVSGSKKVWGLKPTGEVFYREGVNGQWEKDVSGQKCKQIACYGTHVWCVDEEGSPWYRNGWKDWHKKLTTWHPMKGKFKQITAATNGRRL